MSLNRSVIMGRFTKDPEIKKTPNGVSVTSFTLAVERDYKDQDGAKGVDFIDCVAWRNTAEFICKYFGKGRTAIVEGRIQIRSWSDQDGNKHRNAEILVDNIYFGDSKRNEPKRIDRGNPDDMFTSGGGDFLEIEEGDENGELPF